MALGTSQVEELAESYRRVLSTGDQEFGGNSAEDKILHAVVAASVSDVGQWITTRAPAGADIDRPLAELTTELGAAGAAAARQTTLRHAGAAVKGLLLAAMWPVWLSAMLALVGGLFGITHTAGESSVAVALALGLTGGPALFLTIRALGMARVVPGRNSPLVGSMITLISDLGVRSEHIFATTMGPSFEAILQPEGMAPGRTPVVNRIRNWARGVVFLTIFVFAAGVIIYLVGLVHALDVVLGG